MAQDVVAMNIRVPPKLVNRLRVMAVENRRSFNAQTTLVLEEGLKALATGAAPVSSKSGGGDLYASDIDVTTPDGGRTWIFSTSREGEVIWKKEIKTAAVIDRGQWKEGEYEPGDGVTLDDEFWIAKRRTRAKPSSGDWRASAEQTAIRRLVEEAIAKLPPPQPQPQQ